MFVKWSNAGIFADPRPYCIHGGDGDGLPGFIMVGYPGFRGPGRPRTA